MIQGVDAINICHKSDHHYLGWLFHGTVWRNHCLTNCPRKQTSYDAVTVFTHILKVLVACRMYHAN